ncbi:MAG: bifunctional phosphopantothenoylcysteine decarboxylase/phosphopantothenate--cysteine ligase CoaBC [Desulfobulbaceae bacterium]|nr:bifunctional phosphopantothenoylcysteine decarboxylase/phosphopantothenate--cysteine ligase CoaBC [Desulfobulbaceae bacterium]
MTGLQGKKILFGVTGSIAVFKAAAWVHALVKEEALVTVIMTRAATRFVSELTFEALTANPVHVEMFGHAVRTPMAHISLARDADCICIAPATANTIARLANGMADDLLATSVLAASGKPVMVFPAMNCNMYMHPATRDNLQRLRELGYIVVEPDAGALACGDEGPGRLPEWDRAREQLLACLCQQDLAGQQVLITAGPTREVLDPARFLSNRSSGKMGFALARTARRRGAKVVLVTGPVSLEDPPGVEVVHVTSAREMYEEVIQRSSQASIIVKSAAVADFRPAQAELHKVKKRSAPDSLALEANPDILAELGRNRHPGQLLVGFAAESRDHQEEAGRKLREKNLDLVVANDISGENTGFGADTNQVTLVDHQGAHPLPLLSKEQAADRIWDHIVTLVAK